MVINKLIISWKEKYIPQITPFTFLAFFSLFLIKSFVFIIFISFLEEVLNFRNRILTNQKPEYVSLTKCVVIMFEFYNE